MPQDSNSGDDLYMYDHSRPEGNRLTLISADANGNADGAVALRSLGNSADGTVVYFTTRNQILPGKDETSGNKLYRWEEGDLEFLGRVTATGNISAEASVTSDGRYAAFGTNLELGGAATGGFVQAYIYDHSDGSFVCASCRADGAPSTADVSLGSGRVNAIGIEKKPIRYLLDDGRLTFTTADRLIPRDTNGVSDVYTFKDGDLHLISSGRNSSGSILADVSADGDSIFFTTRERLVPDDVDALLDLYVARVNGGIPPRTGESDADCDGADCQGAPPVQPAPADLASSKAGHGNLIDSPPLRIRARAKRVVVGAATRVRVRLPEAGRVILTGPGLRRSARRVARTGVEALPLRLNRRALRQLRHRGAFRTRARVVFRARSGGTTSARVPVVFRLRSVKR